MILEDPDGAARELQCLALVWTWDVVGPQRCDAFVADSITGLAEEVHKLVTSLNDGDRWVAAVQRSVIALHLAHSLAVHFRLLYDSENHLWQLVARRMGEPWRRLQGAALGDGNQSFEETCKAALELYRLAADTVKDLLSEEQSRVVTYACELARP
ncbi:MAG: hypothetical protein ACR2JC_10025 [Chloroflexota bacterium]|nr:MAG: hypothetical protein DLM70_01530 [Chloroflexota bacterium]